MFRAENRLVVPENNKVLKKIHIDRNMTKGHKNELKEPTMAKAGNFLTK